MQPALLIIDLQQALCHASYAACEAEALIQRINAVARRARTAAVPVIFIQHASIGGPLAHDTVG